MSSAPARASRRPVEATHQPVVWTTPALLRLGVYGVAAASLLLMVAVITGARTGRHAMQSIGKDAAPSIIAAQHIRSAMADMDADAAQELLSKGGADTLKNFEARRQEAIVAIITAAQNIKHSETAERLPIQQLGFALGTYTAQVQQARDLQKAGDKNFLAAYHAAAKTMDSELLPAAADLDKVNREVLDFTYSRQRAIASGSLLFVLISALILCGVLIALHALITRRMRRIVSPLLICSLVIASVFTMYAVDNFRAAGYQLKVAKEDCFDSIHRLWQARALAYSANSEEIRYLLDPDQAAASEQSFSDKADRIAHLPEGVNQRVGAYGFLADELKDLTFRREGDVALETLTAFETYRALDKQVRVLANTGRRADAAALATGRAREAFNRFDGSLGRTLAINQDAFDRAVDLGLNNVSGFEISAPIFALLISACAFLGLLPRIREYSA